MRNDSARVRSFNMIFLNRRKLREPGQAVVNSCLSLGEPTASLPFHLSLACISSWLNSGTIPVDILSSEHMSAYTTLSTAGLCSRIT